MAADGATRRQLTHTAGAALWPDVSPDGETIAFAGYTTAGYDVFTMPYPRAAAADGVSVESERSQSEVGAGSERGQTPDLTPVHDYGPLPTLRPTSWSPILIAATDQVRVGAAVSGVDVLGYPVSRRFELLPQVRFGYHCGRMLPAAAAGLGSAGAARRAP